MTDSQDLPMIPESKRGVTESIIEQAVALIAAKRGQRGANDMAPRDAVATAITQHHKAANGNAGISNDIRTVATAIVEDTINAIDDGRETGQRQLEQFTRKTEPLTDYA